MAIKKKFDPEFHLRAAGRLGRLKTGYPLSTGETPAKQPPAGSAFTLGSYTPNRKTLPPLPPPTPPPGASREAGTMRVRQQAERSQGMRRGISRSDKKKRY